MTQSTSRVAQIATLLRDEITSGSLPVGARLPSESDLAREHAASRAVIREAIATLRADGLVVARRGVGVFVCEPDPTPARFMSLSLSRMSSIIEVLELRLACETEAAALAAARRSATQLERILDAYRLVNLCLDEGKPTHETDFDLHLAIAEAAQNPFFPELLLMIRPGFMTRPSEVPIPRNTHLRDEHGAIVSAILKGDETAARSAMRSHLSGSLSRFKSFLESRLQPELH
ncbi:FadR/GntR family transcriptional regulator [Falsirhodobacter deserti]|uniref:FadR/GntR family transcriptional regulator n=1 Tax=Falsirhodobacter deserti TaxID=1365611 RepID=UPI000FE3E69D|nr:FCD domain-containing protein [Falsirhodobacter deserti]